MKIVINSLANKPIYEQISEQIKNLIIDGDINFSDPLPSIRALAKDLKISVITIKRSYDDLEKEGYIYSQPGKGSFVNAVDTAGIQKLALENLEGQAMKLWEMAQKYNVSKEKLIDIIKKQ